MFNENSRVKIPAIIHFTRLGYDYFSLKNSSYAIDPETSIITNEFSKQFRKLNPTLEDYDEVIASELEQIRQLLGNDDLGRQFYNKLANTDGGDYKLIDFDTPENNSYLICTELTNKNGEDEFRPDITVFVNGLPLAFVEVKKPNNIEGLKAERDRINSRFANEKFRKFINITQLIVFSNNMEYDDSTADQLQGAFYATSAKGSKVKFNNFREERKSETIDQIKEIDEDVENAILKDTNAVGIKHAPEFKSNKDIDTPTNRIVTSLFEKNRLMTFLRYGIAYVDEVNEETGEVFIQKHIMRYPQFFATKAIARYLNDGNNRGIIWHTQGSGKTALAYYNVKYLTDFYKNKGIIPKFYFIVDRLDLAKQAKDEFKKRGLDVNTIDNKETLVRDFASNTTKSGMTVVNIQKFKEETVSLNNSGYDIDVQRVFFIDEAHRSYDPKGSFLANLYNADKKAVKIALTGTPLIVYGDHKDNDEDLSDQQDKKTTRNIFGDYIHKYYYNNSIKDGYTLKLLREEIETSYKAKLNRIVHEIETQLGSIDRRDLRSHSNFVEPMLDYIVKDFRNSRIRFGDKTIGAMVVCDSSDQAREMFRQFKESQETHKLKSALILHDEDDKEIREDEVKDFKDGKIDILFVYSMLLTGFDAPRLKKLYLGRKIKAHNLLQTLTRVNRPYREFRIGYVVDFADISKEFEVTNQAYFEELNREYGESMDEGDDPNDVFGSLFMSKSEIDQQMQFVKTMLSDYSTDNLETFSRQINEISDKETINELKKSLESARDIYNIARLLGYTEILEKLDFKLISKLLIEVGNRLKLLNLKDATNDVDSKELLNTAIEDVVFTFTKTGEEELKLLANDLQEVARKARTELDKNYNQRDPEWVTLYEEFARLLSNYNENESNGNQKEMEFASVELKKIYERIKELNRKNMVLLERFNGDKKFARTYKILEPTGKISQNQPLFDVLSNIKADVGDQLGINENIVNNRGYFSNLVGSSIVNNFEHSRYPNLESISARRLSELLVDEYANEYEGEK
jgi:Type I site-specific restriction-modification system, R (restriction) subunit and related helicases